MSAANRTINAIGGPPRVSAQFISLTVAYALARDIPIEDISAVTGVSPLDLVDPHGRVPEDALQRLWDLLSDLQLSETLAVELARAAPLSTLGGLAHGAQFAEDLSSALNLLVKNCRLLADRLEFALVVTNHDAALTFSHPLDTVEEGFAVEVGAGLIWRMVTEIVETPVALARVDFFHDNRHGQEFFETFFDCPVQFGQGRSALVFPRAAMDAAISQANIELFRFVHEYFDQARRRVVPVAEPDPMQALRAAMLENAAAGTFNAEAAAARARMSLRSAQRLAARHGASLQSMIDDIRADSARVFLADRRLSIERVAQFLGYSDDRAFRRAFKRWTGLTPSDFRRRGEGEGDGPA